MEYEFGLEVQIHTAPPNIQYGRRHLRYLPGGTAGYPAHPRLIRLSVRKIRFNYSAENLLIPTIKATIETSWY